MTYSLVCKILFNCFSLVCKILFNCFCPLFFFISLLCVFSQQLLQNRVKRGNIHPPLTTPPPTSPSTYLQLFSMCLPFTYLPLSLAFTSSHHKDTFTCNIVLSDVNKFKQCTEVFLYLCYEKIDSIDIEKNSIEMSSYNILATPHK